MVLGAADQGGLTLNSSAQVSSPLMDTWQRSAETALSAALGTTTTSVQTNSGPSAGSVPDLNPSRGLMQAVLTSEGAKPIGAASTVWRSGRAHKYTL